MIGNLMRDLRHVSYRFPVILSIENHCNIIQQRNMATIFKDIFGDFLLTEPLEANGNTMPSPAQLKRKIIVKVCHINEEKVIRL